MSERQVPFVRLPRRIVDEAMPTLTGAQLKVLLAVVRNTAGWGKPRDWMTQAYLMRATGLASAAVSGAVDSLSRRGLIAVTDVGGTVLATAAERRRRGRLYFALARRWSAEDASLSEPDIQQAHSQTELRIAMTTIDTLYKRNISGISQNSRRNAPALPRRSVEVQPLVVHGPSAAFVAGAVREF